MSEYRRLCAWWHEADGKCYREEFCPCGPIPTAKDTSPINPSHYKQGTIECYDAIASMLSQEELRGYLRGNSLKYRWRYRQKGGVTDLEKAGWYEAKLLEMERGK